ncbi:HAMP domain-containing histidine kinase [Vicingus serpentipes]|uniref:histidine kinase n=1 Tax=Vicingus serpentipes TaxID=1926625 RepID=A0A5C6RR16_9FLAO|nr:HAMP domain-containing sensor histidine kinase [Vicingus serpentipes]TXB64791.1 HAMP domain-containing histidine kinase [Vicingus serpentipes]
MNRKTIRIIILLATVSLIGIIATQFFWVKNAYNLEEKQFNERVSLALSNVTHKLLSINKDEAEIFNPVKQISSNYFITTINDTVHPYLLETLLKNEFIERNINVNFEYVIYDCFTDSIVFGDFISLDKTEQDQLQSKSYNIKWDRDGHYFGVYFPTKLTYIINRMGIWMFSSSIILIIIIFFAYTINVILKQKRLSEIKNDFINNITHEFKTPISTISLSADVLLQPNLSPERLKNYAKIIKDENNRLKNQVDKVLQLATLEKDKLKLENEKLDLHEIINDSIKSFELLAKQQKGKIVSNLTASKFIIYGDRVHISNILYNLIDNAIKYSPEKPKIEIATNSTDEHIEISVKDNGLGIPEQSQKNIFEKFYREPTGNRHDIQGYGLGLNYVKAIVEAYKGKIKLISKEGEGSTFVIKLPFKK